MKPGYMLCVLVALAMLAYAVDRGILIGTVRYVEGFEGSPEDDYIQKRCRYLFITGISEIDARDGRVNAPHARTSALARRLADGTPDNGYCRLFGH
jgi:hypothetical protein